MKTYIFMYILGKDIDKVKKSLGQHIRYWKSLELDHFQNGPFGDKSGGLIIFSASSTRRGQKRSLQRTHSSRKRPYNAIGSKNGSLDNYNDTSHLQSYQQKKSPW